MRIASFNVENLFERVRAMNFTSAGVADPMAAGREILDDFAKLNGLFAKPSYSSADKTKMIDLLTKLGLGKSDDAKYVILRKNHGELLKRKNGKITEITASGRTDWIGWVELEKEAVDEVATQNTARVLKTINADVVVVVEAENRVSLTRFNKQILKERVNGQPYDHIMLIDGNDERGIDVGLLARDAAARIESMVSHVDDTDGSGTIFSRDCAEYHLKLNSGKKLVVLANHLKSKGYGVAAASNARRKAQATRVRQIYQQLRAAGVDHIVIMGDFNDTPGSDPLSPLFNGSDLKDISEHPSFTNDGRPGTYANGTASNKIDYILLSPAVFSKVTGGAVERRGVWGGTAGTLFPHFPEVTKASEAASDHAAIWADLSL